MVAAEIAGVLAWIIGAPLFVVAPIFGAAILGIFLHWCGQDYEKFAFPVPDFGLLKETWETEHTLAQEKIEQMEAALLARLGGQTGPKAERFLAARSLEALSETDYARAGAAARLLLARNPQSLPGLLVSAVSSAWLGREEETACALAAIQNNVGLRGPSVCWAVAWTSMLRGQWARAEALLEQVIDREPDEPTLLNLRALCRLRRGKLQSAIASARRACAPRPKNREHAKFLVDLLLDGGYLNEARTQLLPWDKDIPFDHELMLAAIRLDLASRNFEGADHWRGILRQSSPPLHTIVQLGAFYELANRPEQAAGLYREALARAFFPDACLGLSRLEAALGHADAARRHAMDALNCRLPLGKNATSPLDLLRLTLAQLTLLEPPIPSGQAWIAALPVAAPPACLAGMQFIVFASSQPRAARYFQAVLEAMSPTGPRLAVSHILWRLAPPEHQPVGPVRPGVQLLMDGAETSPFRAFQRRGLWLPGHSRIQSVVEGMRFLPQAA